MTVAALARACRRGALLSVLAAGLVQGQRTLRPSLRLDYTDAARGNGALDLGVGLAVPAGTYVRAGVEAGANLLEGATGGRGGRLDVAVRYLLDPFRESPVGVSVGAGLTARADTRLAPTYGLLLLAGAEFWRKGAWRPAVEVGVGRGARFGVVLRRAPANRR